MKPLYAMEKLTDEIGLYTERRGRAVKELSQLEAALAVVKNDFASAVTTGKTPRRSLSAATRDVEDKILEIAELDHILRGLENKRKALDKEVQAEFNAAHDQVYEDLLVSYRDALKVLIRAFYVPMVDCFNEDSRRLPDERMPYYSPESVQRLEARVEAFKNRNASAAPLPKGLVLMRFVEGWAGSPADTGTGYTTAYSVGEIAAFSKQVAAKLESLGVAKLVVPS